MAERKAGGLTRAFSKGGKMDWRFLLVTALLGGAGGTGGFFGLKSAAPDPAAIEATQQAVQSVEQQMRVQGDAQKETNAELRLLRQEMGAAMKLMADGAIRDKLEYDRRFTEMSREISRLEQLAEKARRVDDLDRRVTELERKDRAK